MKGKTKKKVYKVTFMTYTDAANETVSNGKEYIDLHKDNTIYDGYVLITEDEIEKYKEYGGGIKDMTFVGIMYVEDK